MNRKIIIGIVSSFFLVFVLGFSQNVYGQHKTKQTDTIKSRIYYKNFITGNISGKKQHQEMLDSLSQKLSVNESIISNTTTNDSTIILYTDYKMPKGMMNPYKPAQKYIGKELPFDTLKTIQGNLINIKKNHGKPTLINLWFTTCPPCIKEMPELNKLKEKYGNEVNFIAVTFNSKKEVQKFLKERDFNFIQAVGAKKHIDKMGINAYPTNFFIGKNNKVYYIFGNSPNKIFFEKILKKLSS